MFQAILDVLRRTAAGSLAQAKVIVPLALATLAVLLVGFLVALTLRFLVRRSLQLVRFNHLAERSGAAESIARLGLPPADALCGALVFWLVFIGFCLSGFKALGFSALDQVMVEFVLFVPRLLVALTIFVAGLVAANFVWRATLLRAVNARLPSARFLAGGVRFLIIILAVAMALEQVAIAKTVVLTAFAIVFGSVMLAVAIAFGVGGGPLARRILEQQFPERRDDDAGGASHL